MVNLIGATVRAKPGAEIHAGNTRGRVKASNGPDDDIMWYVEWDQGPPWRGWYRESELEVEEVSR